jgi:hypothetical protein
LSVLNLSNILLKYLGAPEADDVVKVKVKVKIGLAKPEEGL